MSTQEILRSIAQLTEAEKLFVVEKTISSLLKSSTEQQLKLAATALEEDYRNDVELTPFSSLDLEDFYEAK